MNEDDHEVTVVTRLDAGGDIYQKKNKDYGKFALVQLPAQMLYLIVDCSKLTRGFSITG